MRRLSAVVVTTIEQRQLRARLVCENSSDSVLEKELAMNSPHIQSVVRIPSERGSSKIEGGLTIHF